MSRELTPEDYELLLTLDQGVAKKTLNTDSLQSMEKTVLDSSLDELCCICMSNFEKGDSVKTLPCKHFFHENCIDMWLANSSVNCPVDGLPVKI